jgi:hypothetical protein
MNMINKSQAFEALICELLRGGVDTSAMSASELKIYMYKVGVALHNIPHNINNNEPLDLCQLQSLDELDPTSQKNEWGMIVKNIASKFGPIPAKVY